MFKIFEDIEFDPISHKYKFKSSPEIEPLSVTGILKKYEDEFDADKWSRIKANSLGIPQQTIKDSWEKKGRIARDKGTLCHLYLEKFYTDQLFKDIPDELRDKDVWTGFQNTKPKLNQFLIDHQKIYEPIASELIVGCKEWEITGTIDQVFKDKNTGLIYLFDWKTNKKIDNRSKYKMKGSLKKLQACELNKYSLQLELYKRIIEKETGVEIEGTKIVHFPESGDSYQIYNTKDLNTFVDIIIEERINELQRIV